MKKNSINPPKPHETFKQKQQTLVRYNNDMQAIDAEINQININLGKETDKINVQLLTEKRSKLQKFKTRLEKKIESVKASNAVQLQENQANSADRTVESPTPVFILPANFSNAQLPESGSLPSSLSTPKINTAVTVTTEPNSEIATPLASSPSVPNTSNPSLATSISSYLTSRNKSPTAPKLAPALKVTTFAPPADIVTTKVSSQNDRQFEQHDDQIELDALKADCSQHDIDSLKQSLEKKSKFF